MTNKIPLEEHTEKKTVHSSYTKLKEHHEFLKLDEIKKQKERLRSHYVTTQEEERISQLNWEDSLRKPETRIMSPKRFQTPRLGKKVEKKTNQIKSAEECKNDKE